MACESTSNDLGADARFRPRRRLALLLPAAVLALVSAPTDSAAADSATKRWKEAELVASYKDLAASGTLESAVRSPALPSDPPQPMFLEALAWYAAGMPRSPGVLTRERLDEQITGQVRAYIGLLKGKVESGDPNDYPRTRTWKLIQKYTLLRDSMSKADHAAGYKYGAMSGPAAAETDAWERDHTLRSPEEVAQKVCRASQERPVLVKYGNTNCTQCMLFEIIGTIRNIAESPALKGKIDVYKVWWGYQPDESFAGRIRDPQRLDDLAKAEGISSSPFFVVYRNGRRYPCGDAFPDDNGRDARLDSCLQQKFGDAPAASFCPGPGDAGRRTGSGR